MFPEWDLFHPAARVLGWEVAGAPRKGSGCPAWTEEVGWGSQLEELLRFEQGAAAQKVFFSP